MEDERLDITDILNGVDGAELLKPNEKDRFFLNLQRKLQKNLD
jgi:hypothetical protein